MKNLAIMAIPSKNDPVWKISSEKVPHMTILYLGDQPDTMDTRRMEEFLEHVVGTTLHPFGMSVDRRGELGDKNADVLFFSGHGVPLMEKFRHHLLTNPEIQDAYNSADQYPSWTPHLTLGYPETPANPDTREYPGLDWVCFDRIALWTGDYEGVEFPLKDQASDITMSAEQKGELFLRHHGVKGMKWGVVRDKVMASPVVKYASPSGDHLAVKKTRLKAKLVGVRTLSNKELNHLIKRMDLEVKFKDLKTVKHKQSLLGMGAMWAGRVATNILVGVAINWLKRPGFGGGSANTGPVRYPSYVGRPLHPAPQIHRPVRVINGTVVPPAITPGR